MTTARLIAITKFADGILDEIALAEANSEVLDVLYSSEIERLTAYIARVSNPKNQTNPEVAGLLNYCIKKAHWSVFEHGYLTIEIETMTAIATQILRHRSFTFQQLSQRYADVSKAKKNLFIYPKYRRQDTKNRQNSIDDLELNLQIVLKGMTDAVLNDAQNVYDFMIKNGIAKETARFILPQCTATTLYMTGNIRSWIHYIQLRTDPDTQLEHREVALACQDIFISEMPVISKALGWIAV